MVRKRRIDGLVDICIDSAAARSFEPQKLQTTGERAANNAIQNATAKRQGTNQGRTEETQETPKPKRINRRGVQELLQLGCGLGREHLVFINVVKDDVNLLEYG